MDFKALQALRASANKSPSRKPILVEGGVGTGKTTHFIENAEYGNTFIVVPTRRAVAGKLRALEERCQLEGDKFPMRVASNLTDEDDNRFVFGPEDARKVYLTTPEGMTRYGSDTDLTNTYKTFVFDEVHIAHANDSYANLILRFLKNHPTTKVFLLSATYDVALAEMFLEKYPDGTPYIDLRERTWDFMRGLEIDTIHIDDLRGFSFRKGFDFIPKLESGKFLEIVEKVIEEVASGTPSRIACFSATSAAAFLRELGLVDGWKIGVMGTSDWVEKVRIASGNLVEFDEIPTSASVANIFTDYQILIHSPALNAGADIYDLHKLWIIDRIGNKDIEDDDVVTTKAEKLEKAVCGQFTLGDVHQIGGRLRCVEADLPFSADEYCRIWYGPIPKTPWLDLIEKNLSFYLEDNRWLKLRSPTINSALRRNLIDGTASFMVGEDRPVTLTWPTGKFLGHNDPECLDEILFSESVIQVYRVMSGVKPSQTLDFIIEETHGRVYEALIKSPNSVRRAVARWLRPHGWRVLDIDIESAHPNFLLSAIGIDGNLGQVQGDRLNPNCLYKSMRPSADEIIDGTVSPKFALITVINGANLAPDLFATQPKTLEEADQAERYAMQVEAALALTFPNLIDELTPEVRDRILDVTRKFQLHVRKQPYRLFSSIEYDMRRAIELDIKQAAGDRRDEVFITPSHDGLLTIVPRDLKVLCGYHGSIDYKNWRLSSLWLSNNRGLRQEVKVELTGICRWRQKSLHIKKGKWPRPDFVELDSPDLWTWHKKGRAVGKAKNSVYIYVKDGQKFTESQVKEVYEGSKDSNFRRWCSNQGFVKFNVGTDLGRKKYDESIGSG